MNNCGFYLTIMAETFFTSQEQEQIIESIRKAELNTSGEIRLHVEANCSGNPYDRARQVFETLGMHATELKNGVLFYLAYADKKFAIIGDKGIHEKVSQRFWDEEKELLLSYFKQNKFAEGLCLAIEQTGEKLKEHFPFNSSDKNELSNDISFGDEGGNHV